MCKAKCTLIVVITALLVSGCATASHYQTDRGLVGAWLVSASRPQGLGKNLLTFSSDGTFFRSGDTHPVLSGAHGAWKRVGEREFHAQYIAFRFDQNGKWIGSQKTRIRLSQGPGENEFMGVAKVSILDLQDKELSTSETRLEGKRIQVEAF
jgi:hypothetical protein